MAVVFVPGADPALDGYSENEKADTRRAQFGDGYSQRSKAGPNSVGREVSLNWDVPQDKRDHILNFLRARGGSEAFSYRLPWDVVPGKWVCDEWSSAPIGVAAGQTMWRVSAKFEKVFDLP